MQFTKKVGKKNAVIYVSIGNDGKYGGQGLCPYCGTPGKVIVSGFSTAKKAAAAFFSDMALHYKEDHR